MRTREQPVNGPLVRRSNATSEAIVSTIKTLDVELLPRLDPVHLPEFCWQNNLALGRNSGPHESKISSYPYPCRLRAAKEVAGYFDLDDGKARDIAKQVGKAVSKWRGEPARRGLAKGKIDRMASAFEHDDLKAALAAR